MGTLLNMRLQSLRDTNAASLHLHVPYKAPLLLSRQLRQRLPEESNRRVLGAVELARVIVCIATQYFNCNDEAKRSRRLRRYAARTACRTGSARHTLTVNFVLAADEALQVAPRAQA